MTNTQFLPPGTVVKFRGELYRIERVNPKNYRCTNARGESWNLGRNNRLEVATEEEASQVFAGGLGRAAVKEIEIPEFFDIGQPVRMKRVTDRRKFPELFVVINQGQVNLKLARLVHAGQTPDNRTVTAHPSLVERVNIQVEEL